MLELIQAAFYLVGEDVFRARTGKLVRPPKDNALGIRHRGVNLKYHRVKFALAHGWLPPFVDHKDTNRQNNLLDNYRAATKQQNNCNNNQGAGKRALPRGVHRARSGRFEANCKIAGRLAHLGTFDTIAEASAAAEAKRRELHGEFYRQP